jgi:hypothetical protein
LNDVALTGSLPLDPVCIDRTLPATTPDALAKICEVEEFLLSRPQLDIETWHVLHAGIYSRTIFIPGPPEPGKANALTGALVKVPTTLTICGRCAVLIGDAQEVQVDGYHVLAAAANRKQAFIVFADTWLTMSFKTNARTIEEAEQEFTDDHARLMSRRGVNHVTITGD